MRDRQGHQHAHTHTEERGGKIEEVANRANNKQCQTDRQTDS